MSAWLQNGYHFDLAVLAVAAAVAAVVGLVLLVRYRRSVRGLAYDTPKAAEQYLRMVLSLRQHGYRRVGCGTWQEVWVGPRGHPRVVLSKLSSVHDPLEAEVAYASGQVYMAYNAKGLHTLLESTL